MAPMAGLFPPRILLRWPTPCALCLGTRRSARPLGGMRQQQLDPSRPRFASTEYSVPTPRSWRQAIAVAAVGRPTRHGRSRLREMHLPQAEPLDPSRTTRPVRLMQVTYSLSVGGSEFVARDLALGLRSLGVESSVCAVDLGGPLAEELKLAGISTRVMGRRPGFDWRLVLRFARLFLRERPDIVQTHHLTQLIYAGVAARLTGVRLVHVEHEFFSLMHPRTKRYLSILAPLCHRIVAVGDQVRTFLVQ